MAKRIFAKVVKNRIVEIIREYADIDQEWHPDFLAACVEITDVTPQPLVGFVRSSARGNFAPPKPFTPTPEQQAAAAILVGCELEFITKPELNGLYATSGSQWQDTRDAIFYLATFGSFPGDLPTFECQVKDGVVIFKSIDDFKSATKSLICWVADWKRYASGNLSVLPSEKVTIV